MASGTRFYARRLKGPVGETEECLQANSTSRDDSAREVEPKSEGQHSTQVRSQSKCRGYRLLVVHAGSNEVDFMRELPPLGELVMDEVERPARVDLGLHQDRRARSDRFPPSLALADGQPFWPAFGVLPLKLVDEGGEPLSF